MGGLKDNTGCCHAWGHLNERQAEVVALIAQGLSDRQIARRLGLTPSSARHYVAGAMTTAGAQSRAQLVALCYAAGVLVPDEWPPQPTQTRCLGLR